MDQIAVSLLIAFFQVHSWQMVSLSLMFAEFKDFECLHVEIPLWVAYHHQFNKSGCASRINLWSAQAKGTYQLVVRDALLKTNCDIKAPVPCT